ncbi:hypothetical protein I552_8008 [Mycobacterium xenopi 3993]|nr:hypothetical protein I552_8008 [Mycobacterium xenopi 3993]
MQQNSRRCITVTALADVPSPDVIRHHLPRPDVARRLRRTRRRCR